MPAEFEWDDANADHIAAHGVYPDEVEGAYDDPGRTALPVYSTPAERRRGFLGATESGRLLAVVITRRGAALRVVTARDATERERRCYRRYHR